MRRRRLGQLVASTTAGLIVFAGGAAVVLASRESPRARRAPTPVAGSLSLSLSILCRSPALGGSLPARVDLPLGYRSGSQRYPVVYFLHGLPAGPESYKQYTFISASLAGAGRAAIVVTPQGARGAGSDREYLDWDSAENWPRAVSHDLTSCIDARFRTIADRFGRALVGLSAGGYGAFNIGLRSLQTFAAVQSWSGYFEATDPSGDHVLKLGSPQADGAAAVPRGAPLKQALQAWPAMVAFYVGRQDSRFEAVNEQFDQSLRRSGIPHSFTVYPGAHTTSLWSSHASHWLTLALTYLAAGRRHAGR